MSEWRIIRSATTGEIVLPRARWCVSFWCNLRGLQFVRRLPEDEGLLFARASESTVETAIHMLFMFFDIGVVWLDAAGTVVDAKLAKPWRPYYAPRAPARYFIEANVSLLERVAIGDRLIFDEAAH